MPLAATLPAAILETILTHLAALFLTGAGGDPTAARHAVAQMLGAYHPQTEDELRLAAKIVGFSFHALEALGQAAAPDMPITRVLRLRSSAVSASREASKAERRLTQLRNDRQRDIRTQPEPEIEKPIAPIENTNTENAGIENTGKIAIAAKASGQTWTQAYQQRQTDLRIAASLKRAEARIAALSNPAITNQAQTAAHTI